MIQEPFKILNEMSFIRKSFFKLGLKSVLFCNMPFAVGSDGANVFPMAPVEMSVRRAKQLGVEKFKSK